MRNLLWALCLTFVAWPQVAKADACRTTELCETPGERSCVCSARSAGALNFYWRIPLLSGHRYRCAMDSPVGAHIKVLPELCTAPDGVVLAWDACCAFLPAIVTMDAQAMADPDGDAIIKFQVGPSDIPSRVHITCDFDERT